MEGWKQLLSCGSVNGHLALSFPAAKEANMHTIVSTWETRGKLLHDLCQAVLPHSCKSLRLLGAPRVPSSIEIHQFSQLLNDPFFAAPDDREVPKQYEANKEEYLGRLCDFANRMKVQVQRLTEVADKSLYVEAVKMVEGCVLHGTSLSTSQAKQLVQKFKNHSQLRPVVQAVLDLVTMDSGAVGKRAAAVQATYVKSSSGSLLPHRIICFLIRVM